MLISIFCRENANTLNEPLFSFRETLFYNILTLFVKSILNCNFSLVPGYLLKFTRCPLLVKSPVTPCKIGLLLVAKNILLFAAKFTHYSLQKLLVTKNHSLLVAKFDCLLLVAEVARCEKKTPGTNVYLNPIKVGEFYLFILHFKFTKNRVQLPKNRERLYTIKLTSQKYNASSIQLPTIRSFNEKVFQHQQKSFSTNKRTK